MGQTYPLPITPAMLATANAANEQKPRYSTMADWTGGVKGDDVDTQTATVALANANGSVPSADYSPRNQAGKAAINAGITPPAGVTVLGTTLVKDVTRARGWIGPGDPYPTSGTVPVAPTVTSISPTTAPAASLPLTVTITGTGFSPWSVVRTGGSATPDVSGKYIDATHMSVALFAAAPGTVSIAVEDHDLLSNTNVVFTVT